MCPPMTRCECHGVPFSEVARVADEHPNLRFHALIRKAGCGQTCTACHCDLKNYLREHARQQDRKVPLVASPPLVAASHA
jgi:bacterioferritin-associated ferredoxin